MDTKLGIIVDPSGARTGSTAVRKALNDIKGAARDATQAVKSRFESLKDTLFSVKSALLGLGAGFVAKGFIDVAAQSENVRVRLSRMLGSVEEGNRLFENMADYAQQVSFEYSEIMGSAAALAGVLKGGTDEVTKIMPLIGDLAATTGLTIEETTSQIIRMFSAGAASADLFRERGVLAMLGFQAGVSYSAEETRRMLIAAWEDPSSRFRDAAIDLGTTWTGTLSMFADEWQAFRMEVMDSGPFDFLKASFQEVLSIIKDNKDVIGEFAGDLGQNLVSGLKSSLLSIAGAFDIIKPVFDSVLNFFKESYANFTSLPGEIQTVGVVSAFLFGKKGIAALVLISSQLDDWNKTIAEMSEEFKGSAVSAEAAEMDYDSMFSSIYDWLKKLRESNIEFMTDSLIGDPEEFELRLNHIKNSTGTIIRDLKKESDKEDTSIIGLPTPEKVEEDLGSIYQSLLDFFNSVEERQRQMQEARTGGTGVSTLGSALMVEKDALGSALYASDEYNDALKEGKRLYEQLKTPQEEYSDRLLKIQELLFYGVISEDTANRARLDAAEDLNSVMLKQNDTLKEQERLAKRLEGTFTGVFRRAYYEGESLRDMFKNLAMEMAAMMMQKYVFSVAGNALAGVVGSYFGGFANGGEFTVGGSGGTDSQLVAFKATPGENVSVSTPGQVGRGSGLNVINNNYIDIKDTSDIEHKIRAGIRQAEIGSYTRIVRDFTSNGPLRKTLGV